VLDIFEPLDRVTIPCPGHISDFVRCPPDGGARGLVSDFLSMGGFLFFAVLGFVALARFYRVAPWHPGAALLYLASGVVYELFPIAGIIVAANFEPKGQNLLFEPSFHIAAAIFFTVGTVLAALGVLMERAARREQRPARGA
jgi:hypothetical protein